MKLFGRELTFRRATPPTVQQKMFWPRDVSSVPGSGGWLTIHEADTGFWQRNIEIRADSVLMHSIVFACISLISADIAKLRIRLVAEDSDGIWREVKDRNSPFWPVLRRPNHFQNRLQFYGNWVHSKLIHGNTYVLKERDARGIVTRLYILDPQRVDVQVAPSGAVFYRLNTDRISGLENQTVVAPASEIIHDRWNEFFHPLVGIPPISAAGLAATQGINLQTTAAQIAAAGGRPSGILKAPDKISPDQQQYLEKAWEEKYGANGTRRGAIAVVGDGLEFQAITMTSADAQVIEQLKWTSENVLSVFHVPAYKVGLVQTPTNNNIEALDLGYWKDCLQILIEAIELCLDEGLELPKDQNGQQLGTEFDVQGGLFRMDALSRAKVASDAVRSGVLSPDEARYDYFDKGPVKGGDTPYMQQQQYSLHALEERDANKPFSKPKPAVPAVSGPENNNDGGASAQPAGGDDDSANDNEQARAAARRAFKAQLNEKKFVALARRAS